MRHDDFDKLAKAAIIALVWEKHEEKLSLEDIVPVWFCHTLGNKKALYIDCGANTRRYFEVTYDFKSDCMYADMYVKEGHKDIYSFRSAKGEK